MENSLKRQPSKKASSLEVYMRLLEYVKPHWKIFTLSLLGFLIFASTQPMFAALMKYMVDSLNNNQRDAIYWIPLASVAIVFVRGIGSFLGSYFIALVSNSVVHTLRCRLFDHYTTLPSHFFDDNNSGHLISRITCSASYWGSYRCHQSSCQGGPDCYRSLCLPVLHELEVVVSLYCHSSTNWYRCFYCDQKVPQY